jgi:hypothetical protein
MTRQHRHRLVHDAQRLALEPAHLVDRRLDLARVVARRAVDEGDDPQRDEREDGSIFTTMTNMPMSVSALRTSGGTATVTEPRAPAWLLIWYISCPVFFVSW